MTEVLSHHWIHYVVGQTFKDISVLPPHDLKGKKWTHSKVLCVIKRSHRSMVSLLPTITSYTLEHAREGSPGWKDGKGLDGENYRQQSSCKTRQRNPPKGCQQQKHWWGWVVARMTSRAMALYGHFNEDRSLGKRMQRKQSWWRRVNRSSFTPCCVCHMRQLSVRVQLQGLQKYMVLLCRARKRTMINWANKGHRIHKTAWSP